MQQVAYTISTHTHTRGEGGLGARPHVAKGRAVSSLYSSFGAVFVARATAEAETEAHRKRLFNFQVLLDDTHKISSR